MTAAFRWRIALKLLRLAVCIMPEGTARDRWGAYNHEWVKDVQAAWLVRRVKMREDGE